MPKRVDPRERIRQRSIGFNSRQLDFFDEYPEFNPDEISRKAMDKQITLIDPRFLKNEQ